MVRLGLALSLAIGCGSRAPAAKPADPIGRPPQGGDQARDDPAVEDAVAAAVRAHEVLASVSVVPANSHVLGNAAMGAAAAAVGQPPEASAWSGEVERDRGLLRSRIAGVLRRAQKALPADLPLRLARAMAVAADDPHAFALDAPAMGTLLALISGQKGAGFGFAAHQAGAHWVVSDVHPGSPAEAAGIKRGDRVISFDRRAYDDQSVIAMLLTVPGQRVDVELEAGGKRKLVELVAEPHARPIVESRMLGKGMGYLRIHYLPRSKDPAGDAAVLVAGALKELDGKKASKIVIDLRDNVGGSPFDVASILVRGDPLVQIQTPGQPAEKVARTAESWKKKHALAVLINRQSYSAAEIVALALQGHGEARVFGEPSGGALTAPGQAQLPGGVTLFYPGQLFLDARGKAPEEQRVTPDQAVPSTTAEDYAAGRDPQLEAAIAWLKKAPAR